MSAQPIGILDSGVGGLSILREINAQHPHENLIYIADQAHLPYGPRSLEEIRQFSEGITAYLLSIGCKMIVIACNTASAAALLHVREVFPDVPFVGLEPAVRPAALNSGRGTIGVIATEATFQGQLYASLIERFAQGVQVIARACPEFVTLAERGSPWNAEDYALVADGLHDIQVAGADHLVLGCTHFAFLTPLIQAALDPHTIIIDPAPAVARQVGRLLEQHNLANPQSGAAHIRYCTTGALTTFTRQIHSLLGLYPLSEAMRALTWGDDLQLP